MKTLVYLASGNYRPEYEYLSYDRIFLVDTRINAKFISNKVIPLKMDALDSINFFCKNNIQIDCLVCLCESRGEGGQTYAMCSDIVMGYVMPALSPKFIWIANDSSFYDFRPYLNGKASSLLPAFQGKRYGLSKNMSNKNYVSLNLPYKMIELEKDDCGYLNPRIFSSHIGSFNKGHVFDMEYFPIIETIHINEKVSIRIIQDSIWCHYDELDKLFISFKLEYEPLVGFFEKKEKVSYYKQMDFLTALIESEENGFHHVGFTPHYWYQYDKNYKKMLVQFAAQCKSSIIIDFYYLSSWFNIRYIRKAAKQIKREKITAARYAD